MCDWCYSADSTESIGVKAGDGGHVGFEFACERFGADLFRQAAMTQAKGLQFEERVALFKEPFEILQVDNIESRVEDVRAPLCEPRAPRSPIVPQQKTG